MVYIGQWNASLRPALRLSDQLLPVIAQATDGFSFAYLKELFLSAMMRWIATPQAGLMDQVMTEQVEVLRNQMASIEELPSDPGYGQSIAAHPSHPAAIKRGLYRGPAVGPPHPGPQDVPM